MEIKFIANEKGSPAGKLADIELHFTDGPFAGLKWVGFSVWSVRSTGKRNVTVPARVFSVNGERRSFGLLRPISDASSLDALRDTIIAAYSEWEVAQATTV